MPRARAHLGDWVVSPSALHGAAWLSLLVWATSACSLSSGGTGEHDKQVSPTQPADEVDADIAGPDARRDAGLDARVSPDNAGLDGSVKPDAKEAGPAPVEAADGSLDDGGTASDDGAVTLDANVVDAHVVDAGALDTELPDAALRCSLADQFALRIDMQVEWEGTSLEGVIPVLAPGAGVLSMFASLDLRDQNTAVLAPCGTIIPDFAAGNNTYRGELYSVYVPDAAWESPQMPRWRVAYSSTCERPGCAFHTENLLALLGARAVPAAPPRTAAGIELADHDGDGQPAVTLQSRGPTAVSSTGMPYAYPPLVAPWIRARKMMLAMSINGQVEGVVSGCGSIRGAVNQPVFEQGAVACTGVVEGNPNEQNCSSDFVSFLDDNMPQWTVTTASFRAQRIGTGSCAAVRAALP
jgi:hypothetical protein